VVIAHVLAVLCLLAAGSAAAEDLDERIPVTRGGTLEVDLDLGEGLRLDQGSLEIRSHDADVVHVLSNASGWASWAVQLRLDREGDRVRLTGRVGGTMPWLFGGPRLEVQIRVPREFGVDLRTSAGPIRIEDLQGAVRARTRAGAIEVSGVEGPLHLRAASGDIRVHEVTGPVDARTSGGDIRVDWVTGNMTLWNGDGLVAAQRVQGDVEVRCDDGAIELLDVRGSVDAKTERGGVYASFAGEPAGTLETRWGSVEVALPIGAGALLEAS
jgi:hypothetical protein